MKICTGKGCFWSLFLFLKEFTSSLFPGPLSFGVLICSLGIRASEGRCGQL